MSGKPTVKEREHQRQLAEEALRAVAKARRLNGPRSSVGAFFLRVAMAHTRLAGGEIVEVGR